MTNEDKILAILEKHGEVLGTLVQGQAKLEQRLDSLEGEVADLGYDIEQVHQNVVKVQVTLETETNLRITSLHDGYRQHTQILERLHKRLEGYETVKDNTDLHNMNLQEINEERKNLKKI